MRLLMGLLLVTVGCAPRTSAPPAAPGQPATPPARPLAYVTPNPPTLTYEFSDTSISDIQAGPAGAIRVISGSKGAVDLKFEPSGSDQKVTMTFTQFSGSYSNSAGGGTLTASPADIKGPAVLSLTPRGVVNVTTRPEITQAFRSVAGSDNIFRRFFVRLPARSVRTGFAWTDTITSQEVNDGVTTRLNNVVRSTYARDTVLANRTLNVITAEADLTLDVTGTAQGVEIVRKLRGTARIETLWNPERKAVVSRIENVQLTGTFDLPAMSMSNMPTTYSGRSVLRIRE